jgi:hypothetical protein
MSGMAEEQKEEIEQWMKEFGKFVHTFKEKVDLFATVLPADVLEAYKMLIRMSEFAADPNVPGERIREAIFAEIPEERIQWAMDITGKWLDMDEEEKEEALDRAEEDRKGADNEEGD